MEKLGETRTRQVGVKKKAQSNAKATRKAAKTPVLINGVLIGWTSIAKYLGPVLHGRQKTFLLSLAVTPQPSW
jgi:hypothetical protein